MRLSDLGPEARAQVEAQLASERPSSTATSSRRTSSPHGPAPKRIDGYRSKAEADYAAWLNTLPGVRWAYEPLVMRLPGKGSRYAPDFVRTRIPNAPNESEARRAVEVKGTRSGRPFWRQGDRRKALDGAAALWSTLGLALYVAWCVDGVWRHEIVPVRSGVGP